MNSIFSDYQFIILTIFEYYYLVINNKIKISFKNNFWKHKLKYYISF